LKQLEFVVCSTKSDNINPIFPSKKKKEKKKKGKKKEKKEKRKKRNNNYEQRGRWQYIVRLFQEACINK
jgi:hypothetical protein